MVLERRGKDFESLLFKKKPSGAVLDFVDIRLLSLVNDSSCLIIILVLMNKELGNGPLNLS